jgi:aspartate/tyrosine/aromatic aminotransferase
LFGDKLEEDRVSNTFLTSQVLTDQSFSGTGGLRTLAELLFSERPGNYRIYLPDPTYGNHESIFRNAGWEKFYTYKYFDPATKGLDFEGMINSLKNAAYNSVIVLHACAHNPTGVDPT